MSEAALSHLPYRLKLDAPALLTTRAGDPNTVEGERYVPGASLLGAFAGAWIARQRLGTTAHRDATFARWFLRGGLSFLNAFPEDPRAEGMRLLPLPVSFRRPKGELQTMLDLATAEAGATESPGAGFCRLTDDRVVTHTPRTRLRLHTARADRLLARPTAQGGALFSYEALDGGQTFLGSVLGSAGDLAELAGGLNWTSAEPLTFALGRSRSAEYGGQARLSLLAGAPRPYAGETTERQEPDQGLVLTLTAPLLPFPGVDGDGRIPFPVDQFAQALGRAGIAAERAALSHDLRAFARPALLGGFSGVWRLPRPQLAGFAAGSVFVFPGIRLPAAACPTVEARPLGGRTGEGFGRFVLNWHGARDRYHVEPARQRPRALRPPSPPPETFRQVGADVARRWAAEQARAAALQLAEQRAGPPPSPAVIRRVSGLLAILDPTAAPALRDQLAALRTPARNQLQRCLLDGRPLWNLLLLLCSPELADQAERLDRLLGVDNIPRDLDMVLREAGGNPLHGVEQRAALAGLFLQVLCAELERRLRTQRHTPEGRDR